jgi:phage protein D
MSEVLPQDVFVGQDFYAPALRLVIGGKVVQRIESDVVSLTYTDKNNEVDSAELTVNNWDPDAQVPDGNGRAKGFWKYSENKMLDPWQEVEVWMGYYRGGNDELRCMMVGETVRMTPGFTAGPATLTVRALGILNRFRTVQISKDYFQKKDSWIFRDIVQTVAQQTRQSLANIDLVVDDDEINRTMANEDEIKHLTIKQEYAINFLFERSRAIHYELAVDVSQAQAGRRTVTLHFRPPNAVKRATYILEWGKSLISFSPSFATSNQVNQVIVRCWNAQLKKKFEGSATLADLSAEGVIDPVADMKANAGPAANRTEIITDEIVQSDAEATQLAKSRLRVIAQSLISGKGRTIGLPDLRQGTKLQIKGLGRFNGFYLVEQTTHSMGDGGYTTDFTARMEKQ